MDFQLRRPHVSDDSVDYDIITDRTADLMQLADVHRWTVIKTGRTQSVAEHSFNVAVICIELMERLGLAVDPAAVATTLVWALVHDGPEVLTGDIDGKFKRDYPAVREAVVAAEGRAFKWYNDMVKATHPSVMAVVKLADKIEAITWIQAWGVGARADDVYRELMWIMNNESIPSAAVQLGVEVSRLTEIVRHVMHSSVSEHNCIQMRRHRDK